MFKRNQVWKNVKMPVSATAAAASGGTTTIAIAKKKKINLVNYCLKLV